MDVNLHDVYRQLSRFQCLPTWARNIMNAGGTARRETTNLGVGSSNLFGRANNFNSLDEYKHLASTGFMFR
jgi:hypothetical protein